MPILKATTGSTNLTSQFTYNTNPKKMPETPVYIGNTYDLTSPQAAKDEMVFIKKLYGKTKGRAYKSYVISFEKDTDLNIAREIAQEFIDKSPLIKGYQVFGALHTDKPHPHFHLIVNSVSIEDGKKFQASKHDLDNAKLLLNEIALNRGIAPPQRARVDKKDKWLENLMERVLVAKNKAVDMDDFVDILQKSGIAVKNRGKTISFVDLKRQNDPDIKTKSKYTVRLNRLISRFALRPSEWSKEGLDEGFSRNREQIDTSRRAKINDIAVRQAIASARRRQKDLTERDTDSTRDTGDPNRGDD